MTAGDWGGRGTSMTAAATATKARRRTQKSLAEQWVAYHTAHPWTFQAFRRQAQRLRWNGHKRLSAQYLLDFLSFESPVDMRPAGASYKMDHNFGPFYARLLCEHDHSYRRLFELRPSAADTVDYAALVSAGEQVAW